jgi:tRNA-specific 2-thiouridylase
MGHYANVIKRKNEVYLAKAKDLDKDQTYFLCWLTKKQLTRTIFPLGNILKTKVRQIAKAADLSV